MPCRDPFWQVTLKAVRSLGRLKVVRAVPRIGEALAHPQANLRKEAAAALGEIADLSARPLLQAALADADPDVRKNARWALEQIGKKTATG